MCQGAPGTMLGTRLPCPAHSRGFDTDKRALRCQNACTTWPPGSSSFHVMEIFFHHKASPFVRKVLLGIIELSVDTVDRAIDFSSTEAMKEYEQINPNRRFPALRDGELVLWESNAILRYLARRTPWLGQTDNAAALVEQWLCWELAHLGPTLLGLQNYRLGFLPLPPREEATPIADDEGTIFSSEIC